MTSFTVKNIPDHLYQRLKDSASAHHRSINGEVLACLEATFMPRKTSADDAIRIARALRSQVKAEELDPDEITNAKQNGRP